MLHPSLVISPILTLILVLALRHKGNNGMRKLFILFALVFALVTTATATIVTTAVNSDAAMALATR
jgi:hypothetical protein